MSTLLTILLGFCAFALFIVGLTVFSNLLLFPRLKPFVSPLGQPLPRLSFLIPARNESAVIGPTVTALLAQDYPDFEVLVLDDGSNDQTTATALTAAGGDSRLCVLAGQPLPEGWLGKNWACRQLGDAATGDLLVFTDADVLWSREAASALVAEFGNSQADLLTVWPTQTTITWAERLTVPLIALAVLGYLPALAVHALPWPAFAAANGQCLAFRRQAYESVGGHAAVAGDILEDVALARLIKRRGYRLRMADGHGFIRCRMYTGWESVRDGLAKNILAGHANSPGFLILSTLFHWLVFLLPWFLWVFDWRFVALAVAGVIIRGITASFTLQRVRDALLMPVSVVLMTLIAGRALTWHYRGGPQWKGRVARVSSAVNR